MKTTLTPKRVTKVRRLNLNTIFNIEGVEGGTFAIASSKKELKQLMKSSASVVYYEKRGQLYLNENGKKKGWGAEKVGGLLAKFKKNSQLNVTNLRGMISYLDDSAISPDDVIQVSNAKEEEVYEQQIDRTLGRTAPVFNSFQANTAFQVISDTKQDWVDPLTGKTNSVKYELGDDLIVKVEQNNNLSSPIYNMTIYKGIFTYDGSKLARTEVNELITGSVSDAWEGYSYWNFSEPKAFVLQRAASFAGIADFPGTTSTDKNYVTQKSEGLLDGKWHENLFEQNRIV